MVEMKDCLDWPEFQACLPLFQAGARKFTDNVEGQYRFLFNGIESCLAEEGKYTMWRSSIYGSRDATRKLEALATRLGYVAACEPLYGQGDRDWALVVTGLRST